LGREQRVKNFGFVEFSGVERECEPKTSQEKLDGAHTVRREISTAHQEDGASS
jgi:hypothetical protein